MFLVPMTPIRLTAPTATYQLCYFNILLLFFFFFFLRFLLVSFTFVLGFAIFFFLSHFLFLCCSFLLLIPLYFCFILSFQGAGLSIGGFVLFLFYFIWMLIFEGYQDTTIFCFFGIGMFYCCVSILTQASLLRLPTSLNVNQPFQPIIKHSNPQFQR